LSFTLTQPVIYTITSAFGAGNGPAFIFQNLGNVFGGQFATTGTITYTINGGAPISFDTVGSGVTRGALMPNDVYALSQGTLPGANVGDVIRLNVGTETTTIGVVGARPADGPRMTVILDTGGVLASEPGIAVVPEPQSVALVLTGGLGLSFGIRAARRKAAATN
jgi:hypothetical protein